MKKHLYILFSLFILVSCSEYQQVLKSTDVEYKYDKAVEYYSKGKYDRAITLFDEVSVYYRNTERSEMIINYLAKSYMEKKDYYSASKYYETYADAYPRGRFIETAKYMIAYNYYLESPDVRLDQEVTIKAINAFQEFLIRFPKGQRAEQATKYLNELTDKLAEKELINAQLYYDLGTYLGNNYLSAVIVADNALKTYPGTKHREELMIIILKAKYQQALFSDQELIRDRYQTTIDEYYAYINEFPEGKFLKGAVEIFDDISARMSKLKE